MKLQAEVAEMSTEFADYQPNIKKRTSALKSVSPEEICEEVEMIGFDCELTHISEIQQETQKRKTEVKK